MEVDEKIDRYGCTSLPQTVTQGLNCGQSAVTVYHGGLMLGRRGRIKKRYRE